MKRLASLFAFFAYLAVVGAPPAAAADNPMLSGVRCSTIAVSDAQDVVIVSRYGIKVIDLDAAQVKAFKRYEDGLPLGPNADIVTLYVRPDGIASFAVGSREADVKCIGTNWVFTPDHFKQMLRAVNGDDI